MNMLLQELLKRISLNCEGSNHELTRDQLDDITDSLSPFALRFDQMESFCELANANKQKLPDELQDGLSELFSEA